ncbi:SapB/AmfS family lanthipeptide [Longispora sp. NPDC051575]
MVLLDLQGMTTAPEHGGGHGGHGSTLSVTLCGHGSGLSVLICD